MWTYLAGVRLTHQYTLVIGLVIWFYLNHIWLFNFFRIFQGLLYSVEGSLSSMWTYLAGVRLTHQYTLVIGLVIWFYLNHIWLFSFFRIIFLISLINMKLFCLLLAHHHQYLVNRFVIRLNRYSRRRYIVICIFF
jgi:hypothetical protein